MLLQLANESKTTINTKMIYMYCKTSANDVRLVTQNGTMMTINHNTAEECENTLNEIKRLMLLDLELESQNYYRVTQQKKRINETQTEHIVQ